MNTRLRLFSILFSLSFGAVALLSANGATENPTGFRTVGLVPGYNLIFLDQQAVDGGTITLQDIFSSSDLEKMVAGRNISTSDNIMIWDHVTQSFSSYYLRKPRTDDAIVGWVQGSSLSIDQNPISTTEVLLLRRGADDISVDVPAWVSAIVPIPDVPALVGVPATDGGDMVFFNGEECSFRVVAWPAGGWPAGELSYSWSRDGAAIASANGSECRLGLTFADAGAHTIACVVSNETEVVYEKQWNITVKRRLWVKAGNSESSPTGENEASAFRSLQSACNAAQNGDVIWVLPGTYAPFYRDSTTKVTIQSAEGFAATVIDGWLETDDGYIDPGIWGAWDANIDDMELVGFSLNACVASMVCLRNCVITNYDSWNSYYYYPVEIPFRNVRLENCLVTGNSVSCMFSFSDFVNCTIAGNLVRTTLPWDDPWMLADMTIGFVGPDCTVRNSIVRFNYDENGDEINFWDGTTGYYGGNEPSFGYSATFPMPGTQAGPIVTNNPAFIDAVLGDWRLSTGSPCLNYGLGSIVTSEIDLAGSPRIQGTAVDLGCYEGAVTPEIPGTPGNVRVSQGTAAEFITVTWSPANRAQWYQVFRSSNSNYVGVAVGRVDGYSFADTNAVANMKYWYSVRASNASGVGDFAEAVSGFRTPPLVITTEWMTAAKAGDQYSCRLEAEGGRQPYEWMLTSFKDYSMTRTANSFESVSGTSVVSGDDVCGQYSLPFSFPFFGNTYETVWINSNGTLNFDEYFSDYSVDETSFMNRPMIAAMWRDLTGSVYVSQQTQDSVTFRWSGSYYSGSTINVSATLYADGRIVVKHGSGNASGGLVGVSDGNGTAIYENISSSLSSTDDFVFTPVADADWMQIDNNGLVTGRPLANQTNIVTATVTDSLGNTARREYEIVVSDCTDSHPAVQACLPSERALEVFPQDQVAFTVEAVDPDGNDIVYTWIVDGVTNMTGSATAFSWTPDAESSGSHTIACRVADGYWDDLAATWTVSLPDWFVSPDGSPSNSGKSIASAFDSLQAAIDAASAGDTIYVADGTYTPVSTANKTVRILAAPGASPVIDGGGTNRCVYVGNGSGYTNTVFKGFTLRNGYSGNANGGGATGGTFIGCTIEDCRVNYNNGYYGGGTYYADLENCTVRNCRAYYGGGVSYGTIRNCVIRECTATYYGGGTYYGTYSDTTIRDNRARQGSGVYCGTYTRCTIAGNRSQQYSAVHSATLNYSILWGNTFADGLNADTWRTSLTASYSCVQNGATGTGNIKDDPILVEWPDGHIGPWSGSPALGKGDRGTGPQGEVLVSTRASGPGFVSRSVVADGGETIAVAATLPNALHKFSGFTVGGEPFAGEVVTNGLTHSISLTVPENVATLDVVAEFVPLTLYVSPNGDNANDGLSWETARKTIQSAVDSAVSFDTILVTNGTYSAFSATNNSAFVICGVEGAENTVVDGAGSRRCATLGAVEYHTLTTLEGLTLQNGYCGNAYGGGVYGGKLRNCVLTGNRSNTGNNYGGGGSAYSALYNCVLTNNTAYNGGGTYYGSSDGCVIENNMATYQGGGVYYGTHIGGTIRLNTAGNGGGAHSAVLLNSLVSDNIANNGHGGGTYSGATTNCVISANRATASTSVGGGAYSGTHFGTQFTANTAVVRGGGASDSTLVNCTVVSNSASTAPGFYAGNATRCISWNNYISQSEGILTSDVGQAEPMLVLGDDGIYRLSVHSPLIDAGGTVSGLPARDLAGNARVQGAGVDFGAVEGGVAGNWVGLANDGYGEASANVAVADGESVTLTATQGDEAHAFLGFFVGDEALGGVVSEGLTHSVTFTPTAETTEVVARFERRTFHVFPDGDDAANGRSWETAKKTINGALACARTGDTVLCADGVYAPFTFSRNDFVTIRSANGHEATVIDGGNAARCATFGGVSTVSDTTAITNAVLEGFTLRNGRASNGGGGQYGTYRYCRFENNVATSSYGGGLYYGSADSCVFWNNSAQYGGGMAYARIYNCTVSSNAATTRGGGCYAGYSYNSIIAINSAPDGGNYYSHSANNVVTANPGFVYPADGDLRLRDAATCFDTGNNSNVRTEFDISGAPRIQGGTVGVGAYEGGVPGFVVGTAIVGYGDVSPKYAIADATDEAIPPEAVFTAVESDRPFLGFETNGVFVSAEEVGDTLTYAGVASDANVTLHFATNIYVNAATGDDANGGFTPETAKKTLQVGIDLAKAGETVFVAPGTYAPVSVTNKSIRVIATDGCEKTVIDGGGVRRCVTASSNYSVLFVGFTICNGNQSTGNGTNAGGGGVVYGEYHNCVIRNCRTHIPSYGYGGGAFRAKLVNCLIVGNTANAGGGTRDGTLINCTVVGNRATSWGGGGVDGGTVQNSIVWNNIVDSTSSSYVSTYNHNGGTFVNSCTSPSMSGTGNISSDPRFVDAANGDYRLLDHSPCIDAASASYVTDGATDLLGNPRVVGAAPDMGCYEGAVELPLPATPSGFEAADGRKIGFVRLSWNAADWAWSYRVERASESVPGAWTALGTTDALFFDDQTAVPGDNYYYRVWGVNPEGSSESPSDEDLGWCLAALGISEPDFGTITAGIPFEAAFSASGGAGSYLWRTGAESYNLESADSSWIADDGASTGVSGDDSCQVYPLPFDFPFYGRTYDKVWVNSNGALAFDSSWTAYSANLQGFTNRVAIAVLWKDLRTGGRGVTATANGTESVSFHWNGCTYYSGGAAVNASVTLFADGTIVCSYGSGNSAGGFVGISAGDGVRYEYLDFVGSSMANADDIVFAPEGVRGMTLSPGGVLSGTADAAGTYAFTVAVSDAYGNVATLPVSLSVEENPNMRRVEFALGEHGTRVGGGALVQGVLLGGDATAPVVRAASGWVFDGWDADFTVISDNLTVTAQWRPAKPAIRVIAVAAPVAVNAGDDMEVSWTLENWGNAAFNGTMAEEVRLVPAGGGASVTVASVSCSDQIARDGTVQRSASFALPKKGMEGEWIVRVVSALRSSVSLHATGVSAEAAAPLVVSAIPLPDLTVADVAATSDLLVPGGTISVSYAVRNDGAADAAGPWTDSIWLVSDTSGDAVKLADIARAGTLAPGEVRAESAELAIPETVALAGAVRARVVADSADAVVESDDGDNAALSGAACELARRLFVSAASTSVSEANGSVRLTVKRSGPRGAALVVSLSATPSGELSVPETVTIPSGNASANVTARGIDNSTVEGPRQVSVTASADGFDAASAEITVTDNETPHIYLSLSGATVREGGTLSGSVRRELVTDSALVVYLSGPSTSRCSYPSSVTIPAGEGSAAFEISVPDNTTSQREVSYALRASASGHVAATAPLSVEDDDIPGFTLELYPEIASEGAGPNAVYATLTRVDQSQIAKDVTVRLSQSPAGNLILPASIKVPKYTMAVRFAVGTVDNALDDGDREVEINGAVVIEDCGCDGQPSTGDAIRAVMTVIDDDGPALSLKAEPATMKEGLDEAGFLVLSHNSALTEDLEIALSFDVEGEIDIPATTTIPAGVSSVRIPVRTLDDGVEDGAKLVSVYAEEMVDAVAPGDPAPVGTFAPASTWLQVSDQNLPDLAVAEVAAPWQSIVGGSHVAVSFQIANNGFASCRAGAKWQLHFAYGDSLAISTETLVAFGTVSAAIDAGESVWESADAEVPRTPGDGHFILVLDPEGIINELDEANNLGNSRSVSVEPMYTVDVRTDVEFVHPNTAVDIFGEALLSDGRTPASRVDVDVFVLNAGYRRTLRATTDAMGRFSVTFVPVTGEAGHYEVGASYPGMGSSVTQISFDIVGLKRTSSSNLAFDMRQGDEMTSTVWLKNLSPVPLTAISVSATGVPDACSLVLEPCADIPGNGTAAFTMRMAATGLSPEPHTAYEKFYVSVETAEGASLSIPVWFLSREPETPHGRLVFEPTSLTASMAVGETRYVETSLTNLGLGETGDIRINVPVAPWLRLVSANPVPSLAPGETAAVLLELAPDDSLAMNAPIQGRLSTSCDNAPSVALPFTFTPVSSAVGTVKVSPADEYTYYTAHGPHVSNATVRVTNPYTGAIAASGITDECGMWTSPELPCGTWTVAVSAERHEEWRANVGVEPGTETELEPFLSYNAVTYRWEVVETEVEDVYDIKLVADYVTSVPKPVVVIDAPTSIPKLAEGESHVFNMTIINNGLVSALNIQPGLASDFPYSWEILDCDLSELKAKSSVTVPIRVFVPVKSRKGPMLRSAADVTPPNPYELEYNPCSYGLMAMFEYLCPGPSDGQPSIRRDVARAANLQVAGLACDAIMTVLQRVADHLPTNWNGPTHDPIPGGGDQWGDDILERLSGLEEIPPEIVSANCRLVIRYLDAIAGYQLRGYTFAGTHGTIIARDRYGEATDEDVLNALVEDVTSEIVDQVTEDLFCIPLEDEGIPDDVIDDLNNLRSDLEDINDLYEDLQEAEDDYREELGQIREAYRQNREHEAQTQEELDRIAEREVQDDLAVLVAYDDAIQTLRDIRREILGPLDQGALGPAFLQYMRDVYAEESGFENAEPVRRAMSNSKNAVPEGKRDLDISGNRLSRLLKYADWVPEVSRTDIEAFAQRWNRSVAAWERSMFSRAEVPEGENDDIIDFDVVQGLRRVVAEDLAVVARLRGTDYDNAREKARLHLLAYRDSAGDGVCARISLSIDQKAVVARQAFEGTLAMFNGHPSRPIENIRLELSVSDESGYVRNERFGMSENGLVSMRGSSILDGDVSLSPNTTGSAKILFVPTHDAAPDGPAIYRFGGTLTYTDPFSGNEISISLYPVALRVDPSPRLTLHYFLEQEVFADDPFTEDVVEPSLPAELALLVVNSGAGEVRSMSVHSAQPEVFRNDKGLAVDFSLSDFTGAGTAVNGVSGSSTLNVSLGNIPAGGTAQAQWWLKSSVQGRFAGMKASFTQLNNWGNPETCLIEASEMHHLVRSVVVNPYDPRSNFLTSEEDALGWVDTVWTADAERIDVERLTLSPSSVTYSPDGTAAFDLSVSSSKGGWGYGQIPDPAEGRRVISSVVRPDGTEVPLRNVWLRDRSIAETGSPIYGNVLHFSDSRIEAGVHTYRVNLAPLAGTGPEVSMFEGMVGVMTESTVRDATAVVFTSPIDPESFTVDDLILWCQGEKVADLSSLSLIRDDDDASRWTISGLSKYCSNPGRYELVVQASGISDMNGRFGSSGKNAVWVLAPAEAPYVIGIDGVPRRAVQELDAVTVVLSQAVDPASFTRDALRLDGAAVGDGVSVRALDDSGTRFSVEGLAAVQTADGAHVLSVDATGLRSLDGEAGVESFAATWTRDTVAPSLLSVEREETLGGVRFLVSFSEDVDEGSITLDRFVLSRSEATRSAGVPSATRRKAASPAPLRGDNALPATAALENLGGGVWALTGLEPAFGEDGVYTLSFSADGVADEAGNEAQGQGSVSWTRDTTPPETVQGLHISPDLGSSDSDGITSEASVTVLGTLPDDAARVEISVRHATGGAGTVLVPAFAPGGTALASAVTLPGTGNMTLVVTCADEDGNAAETTFALYLDPLALTATLSGIPADPADVADAITLAFSDAVDAATVALSDFALYHDGAAVALEGAALKAVGNDGSPESAAPLTFTLSGLGALCGEDGLYRLVFDGSRVEKALTGRRMDAGAAVLETSWTRYAPDRDAPFVTSVAIDGAERGGDFFDAVSAIDIAFSEPVNVPDLVAGGWIGQAVKLLGVDADGLVESVLLPEPGEIGWNEETATLRWTLPNGLVGPGNWRVSLDAGFLSDAAGNALSADGADTTVRGLVRFETDAAVAVSVAAYAMPSFGDFDGDGDDDLLVGEKSGDGLGRVRLFRNTGLTGEGRPVFATAGTLAAGGAEITLAAQGCQGASAALLPRSGVADLVVGDAFGNVFLHPAEDNGWGAGQVLFAGDDEAFGSPRAVVSASDILGSGRASLVFGGLDGKIRRAVGMIRPNAALPPRLAWLEDFDGEPLRVAAGRSAPAAFDLNGDAIPDLVSGDTAGNVWAFLGDGRLSWQNEPILLVGAGSLPDRSRVAVADFSGTGAPTLAVGRSDGSVRLHSGSATPSPAFDFTVLRTPPTLPAALDAPSLVWATGGASPWIGAWTDPGVGSRGGHAARPEADGPAADGAWLETSLEGAGRISFRVRVPAGGSLAFAIDGSVMETFPARAGEAWADAAFTLSSGTHEARWTWTVGDAEDAAAPLLDAVSWEAAPWTDSAAAVAAEAEFREFLETNGLLATGADEAAFVNASLSDDDGDGQNAWAEFVAMTNPTDPDDRLVADIAIGEDGAPVITWDPDRPDDRDYVLEGADEVSGPYVPVDSAAEDGAAPSRFYRVKVLLK